MTLKQQLLVVSLILLLLPWGGYLLIHELEVALRETQQRVLTHTLALLRHRLQAEAGILETVRQEAESPLTGLFAYPLLAPPVLDGFPDEWNGQGAQPTSVNAVGWGEPDQARFTLLAGQHEDKLLLYVAVKDGAVRYHPPAQRETMDVSDASDSLWIAFAGRALAFKPQAPGSLAPELWVSGDFQTTDRHKVSAFWQETGLGYQIEVSLPMEWANEGLRLGVAEGEVPPAGLFEGLDYRIVYRHSELEALFRDYLPEGATLTLVEPKGWVIGRASLKQTEVEEPEEDTAQPSDQSFQHFFVSLLRWAVLMPELAPEQRPQLAFDRSDLTQAAFAGAIQANWFSTSDGRYALSSVAMPIPDKGSPVDFVLRMDQHTRSYASLSNNTISEVLTTTLGIYLLATGVLLTYAGVLSFRVRRLRAQLRQAISEEGRIQREFTPSQAQDELGDLSRGFHQMFLALEGYTEYLESFASKLAHEIKTPVAIVRTSLDNLGCTSMTTDQAVYVARARDGCTRIAALLDAMRSASRLEQAIQHVEKETFSLSTLLSELVESYQQTLPDKNILIKWGLTGDVRQEKEGDKPQGAPVNSCLMWGAPELIAQLLDKLIDNAKDFAPPGGHIAVHLKGCWERGQAYVLAVTNQGPFLPDSGSGDIFSSFVSLRETGQEGHFGLGLVIVRLIAEYHGGRVSARNLYKDKDGFNGVEFSVTLPYAPAESHSEHSAGKHSKHSKKGD